MYTKRIVFTYTCCIPHTYCIQPNIKEQLLYSCIILKTKQWPPFKIRATQNVPRLNYWNLNLRSSRHNTPNFAFKIGAQHHHQNVFN